MCSRCVPVPSGQVALLQITSISVHQVHNHNEDCYRSDSCHEVTECGDDTLFL